MRKPDEATGIYLRGAVYWLNYQKNGHRKFISLETSDFAEAIANARDIRTNPDLNSADSFESEITAFLGYKRRKNEFTAASAHGRGFILRAFAAWIGKISPAHVTSSDVQEYYDGTRARCSVVTANSYAMILRSFFAWCVSVARLRRTNPCDGLDLVEEDTRGFRLRDFCSEAERDKLISTATRADLKFVLFCGFHAGLRKNEIIEARPWWFDLRAGLLHLRETPTIKFKDREERTIPITRAFQAFLKEYGLHEPYMLQPTVKHGKNRYRYDFTRPFMDHAKAQGLSMIGQTRLTPHLMRHTFASLLVSNGVSLYKVSAWLGDEPGTVEKRYARLRPNDPDIERSHSSSPEGASGNSPATRRSQHLSRARKS